MSRPTTDTPSGRTLVSIAVEAKSGESFDHIVDDWLKDAKPSSGKTKRLEHLCQRLRLARQAVGHLRYQLFHRTVVALSMAERFGAGAAVLLVQAFGGPEADASSRQDFQAFARALGSEAEPGSLAAVPATTSVPLFLGWLNSPVADEECLAVAIVPQSIARDGILGTHQPRTRRLSRG